MIELIAHRGAAKGFGCIENTLEAFEYSLQNNKIDGIELDLHLTKDKKLIIYHDDYIVVDDKKKYIHMLKYEEILQLKKIGKIDTKIMPLLEDFLELLYLNDCSKKIFLELKATPFFENRYREFTEVLFYHLKNVQNLSFRYYLITFNFNLLNYCILKNKTEKLNINFGEILHKNILPDILYKKNYIDAFFFHKYWIDEFQLKYLKNNNKEIYLWTVNLSRELSNFPLQYLDGLISDVPIKIYEKLTKLG